MVASLDVCIICLATLENILNGLKASFHGLKACKAFFILNVGYLDGDATAEPRQPVLESAQQCPAKID